MNSPIVLVEKDKVKFGEDALNNKGEVIVEVKRFMGKREKHLIDDKQLKDLVERTNKRNKKVQIVTDINGNLVIQIERQTKDSKVTVKEQYLPEEYQHLF